LASRLQAGLATDPPDGVGGEGMDGTSLGMGGLIRAFQSRWRENREALAEGNAAFGLAREA
jgi:hypothetical protein